MKVEYFESLHGSVRIYLWSEEGSTKFNCLLVHVCEKVKIMLMCTLSDWKSCENSSACIEMNNPGPVEVI